MVLQSLQYVVLSMLEILNTTSDSLYMQQLVIMELFLIFIKVKLISHEF